MPRYTVTLRLSMTAETQQEAGEVADNLCEVFEDRMLGGFATETDVIATDITLRPIAVSWPEDSDD